MSKIKLAQYTDEEVMCRIGKLVDAIIVVDKITEKYRTVILLIYLEGMTLQETARVIRVSPPTVCRRLGKARSLLKG